MYSLKKTNRSKNRICYGWQKLLLTKYGCFTKLISMQQQSFTSSCFLFSCSFMCSFFRKVENMPPAILQKEKSDVSYWVKTQMEWNSQNSQKRCKSGCTFLKKTLFSSGAVTRNKTTELGLMILLLQI